MTKKFYCTIFLLFLFTQVKTQTLSNLEGFYLLVDKSVLYADSIVGKNSSDFTIVVSLPPKLELLKTRIIDSFLMRGFKVSSKDSLVDNTINYSLINAETNYLDIFRDGLFGNYLTVRKLFLSGTLLIDKKGLFDKPENFSFEIVDSVRLDEVQKLENQFLPFTIGTMPEPGLISNLLEPILVVSAVIVSVILFFTVRGK